MEALQNPRLIEAAREAAKETASGPLPATLEERLKRSSETLHVE
jgi:hypothetical protein